MTAASSVKTASNGVFYKFSPYYRNKMRVLKPQMIMMGIFALLSYPFAGFFCNLLTDTMLKYDELSAQGGTPLEFQRLVEQIEILKSLAMMSMIIGAICLLGMFVFTFVTTLRAFRRLYNKTAVDMDYSLPVSGNTRYFADISAIFTTCILPHLLSVLIGLPLACSISGKMCKLYPYYGVENIQVITSVVIQGMFAGLLSCVMLIGFSLLIMSCCGKRAEAAIIPIMVNIAIPIIQALAITISQQNVYGAVLGTINIFAVSGTSPVGMAAISIYDVVGLIFGSDISSLYEMNTVLSAFQTRNLIPAILLTLASFVGAYFLLKFRKNERVGMPYVFKAMSVILPGIVILAMSLPMWNMVFAPSASNASQTSYNSNAFGWFIGLLISTFIVYVIMELISGKAFRKFGVSVAKWAGTIAACAGITAVFVFSNGFGAANYVPSANDVKTASIDLYTSIYERVDEYTQNEYSRSYNIYDTANDDIISAITDIHSRIPKHKSADSADIDGRVNISYTLGNGEFVSRRYALSAEEYQEYMNILVTPESWYESNYGNRGYEEMLKKPVISALADDDTLLVPNGFTLSGFLEAVRKDAEGMNYSKYLEFADAERMRITVNVENSGYGITYYPWMENTVKYLSVHFVQARASTVNINQQTSQN